MERRNCQEVILKMIEKIPADKTEFIEDLKWNFEDAGYKAPEETLQWHRTMSTLQKHIADPGEDWEFEVLSIFTTKSVEELKNPLFVENVVYVSKSEEYWDKPYSKKRSDVWDTRTVILKVKITEIQGEEFKAELFDNNGFEKDGQEFIFHKNSLLSNQKFKDTSSLGVWKKTS